MRPDRRLDEYAARQFGAFSLEQARETGMTDRMVDGRVRSGAWVRLAPGVYALASSPPVWERQLAAAVLSRPGSLVAGRSAALLHGFTGVAKSRPVIMVPLEGNPRSPIARIVRSRHFAEVEQVRVRGFPVMSPSETIVFIAGEFGPTRLEVLVDDCLASGSFDADSLMATIEARKGQRGITVLRRLAAERLADSYQPPATELERLLYRLLSNPRIPPVVRQFPFPIEIIPMTVDAYIPRWRLIVEADGRRWHTRKADFERDRQRDNLATATGVAVLRFSYSMLTRSPDSCLATVLETGRARSLAS
jgi:very-short-patch-repair endonuclease